jgi:periplasmic protein TonB
MKKTTDRRIFILLASIFITSQILFAELNSQKVDSVKNMEGKGFVSTNAPIFEAEIMPIFPGGEQSILEYIKSSLTYPSKSAMKGAQGRVIVRFVVTETGEIGDVKVVSGFDPDCDNEAARVIKSMPRWIPGKNKGENVAVYYQLPIAFKLKK